MISLEQDTPFAQMVWFMGVVEDIKDPDEKLHRVRARALGFHADSRGDVPHESLPWAPVLSDGGWSAHMLLPGDWVIGFFMDGKEAQQPIIFGKMHGKPEGKDKTAGFSDPEGIYPRVLDKGTNSPLARGETEDTYVDWKKENLAPDEPESPFAAEYPANHVTHTDMDNIIELDDTPGAERVHIFHRSGSFIEFHPDGKVVIRSVKEMYEATFDKRTMYVKGNLKIMTPGNIDLVAVGDINIRAKGDVNIKGAKVNIGSGGEMNLIASGTNNVNGSSVQLGKGSDGSGAAEDVEDITVEPFREPG